LKIPPNQSPIPSDSANAFSARSPTICKSYEIDSADWLDSKRLFLRANYYQQMLLLVLPAALFLLWAAPWRALECGADEGMEFSKMLLLLHHPELVNLAWNDQPWFYSQVFASIFRLTGFHCGIPRLITFVIVFAMLLSFARLMPTGAGWLHLLCGWAFFLCWANMPQLSISAMLEMPAFGMATIAVALTPRRQSEWHLWRFFCVGFLLAVAIQIKLTAAIILPALVAKMAIVWWREVRFGLQNELLNVPLAIRRWWIAPVFGLGVFGIGSALIVWWSPDWNWSLLVGNHLAAGATSQAAKLRFDPATLLASPGTVVAALLSLIVLWRQHRLCEFVYPIVLLVSVLLIHINHRPWWYYYEIHFAVPLAILGGWGAGELLRLSQVGPPQSEMVRERFFSPNTSMMVGSLIVALWTGFEMPRGYTDVWSVEQQQHIADSDEIKVLKEYQPQTKWAYTRLNNLTAQSGYVLPPELTVLPQKRFWTGEVTEKFVLDIVKKYQCEVVILMPQVELKQKDWNDFLAKDYMNVWSDAYESIFVAKRLNPTPPPKREDILKKLGL